MHLYHSISSLQRQKTADSRAIAVGVFDGLHIGHQTIVRKAVEHAATNGMTAMVFTFEPMPREYFAPENPPSRLTRFRERFELIDGLGVHELFCPRFAAVQKLPAHEFIDALLVDLLSAGLVVVGEDFRFGAGREGDVALLETEGRRHGFELDVVPAVVWQGRRVSSTAIREALESGKLDDARQMLGRDYSITGRVVRGRGLGKAFGFPTANVNLKRRLAPVDGIFAVRVSGLGNELRDGVASVGTRPTVGGGEPLLEVLIFDFDEEIYGRNITVHFVSRLREERKFDDVEAMKAQMHLDVRAARAALAA